MAIVNSNELHRSVSLDTQSYERYGINIKPLLIDRLSSKQTNLSTIFEHLPGENNLIHLNENQVNHFVSLYHSLENSLNNDAFGHDILLRSDISRILVFISRLYRSSSFLSTNIMPQIIQDVMEYVKNHLTESIVLEDLSGQFFLNGAYISQQFKHYTGLTLRTYILDQRIGMAKTLLLEGKNVSETCALSGFSDYSNFIRSFTKQVGVSPGKYRQTMYQ
jgi:AraC-like DNA-binding protein